MINSSFNVNINDLSSSNLSTFDFDTYNCPVSKSRCLDIIKDTKCVTMAIHRGGTNGFSYSFDTKNWINEPSSKSTLDEYITYA